ncbi:hint-domain-containing protein [Rhizoctonia solani]|nr:hint-domain-containing protein [Rhizoctonia solani]
MVAISPSPSPTEPDAPPAYNLTSALGDLDIALVAQTSSQELLVSLVPPAGPKPAGEKKTGRRAPVDLCLVIDVSGSMDTEAPVPGEQDKNETTGLSVLDVVKHATRTIIESMGDDDRIAIVTFSDSAEVVAPLTVMDKFNRAKVWDMVEGLRTRGMTNLWDGLKTGMNVVTGNVPTRASAPSGSSAQLHSVPPPTYAFRGNSWLNSISLGKKAQSSPPTQVFKAEPESETKVPFVESPLNSPYNTKDQRLSAVFILTDGQPNIDPPRGHIPMLKSYLDALPPDAPKFTISTFGFGYNLDSRLLDEIADLGQGMYGFIPDSGMVGTVFVHALANLMSTWATGCTLDVEIIMKDPNAEVKVKVLGALPVTHSSWGASIRVGDIQYGQPRDVVLQLPSGCLGPSAEHAVNVTARYFPHTHSDRGFLPSVTRTLQPNYEVGSSVVLQHHVYRLSFICAVSKIFQGSKKTSTTCPITKSEFERSISNYINNPVLKDYEPSKALTTDITSQVTLGLDSEHWARWGMHYIPSLARSHQGQRCLNFKDEGLQVYGRDSAIFISTRDRIDQTFDSLPPPKPSLKDRAVYRPGSNSAATYSPVASMAMYRSSSAPCFAGWCSVDTKSGKNRVSDLRRGTVVCTPNGTARVVAILKTVCPGRVIELCTIGKLVITPWHPMHHQGSWVFPAQVCEPKSLSCDYVYSILLEPSPDSESHAVFIEGTRCVTLGHGCTDLVRAHPFLSNYARVVESLSQFEGYYDENGVIGCAGVARDNLTNMVCGFERLETNGSVGLSSLGVPQRVICEI